MGDKLTTDPILNRRRAPTIVDVARLAGVSVGTVSRYLNGIDIRDAKRLQIENAISELKYSRNAAASAMRSDRSNLVAILMPAFGEFFGAILSELNDRLTDEGQVLLAHRHDRDHRALALALQFFRDHRVNAVITPGVADLRGEIEALIDAGIPVILFNNDIPGLKVDRVLTQNAEGIESAMRYLMDMGHRHIGFIGGDVQESSAIERREGYQRAVRANALPVDESYIVGDAWSRHMAYFSARQLMELPKPPTAILAASIDLALGVMDYAADAGLMIGEEISLMSFDDAEIFQQNKPGITCIAQPTARIGEEIAQLVMSHISGHHDNRHREIRLECEIRLRRSVRRI